MGLGSFVKNVVSLGSSSSAQREQDSANRAAMTSWTMANDYNHPVAQMERLKAAGLNPNLVYGSGSVTGNTASAPDLVGSKEKSTLDYASRSGERLLSAATGKAQLDNTIAQGQLTTAQATTARAQASNAQAIAGYELKSAEASADYDVAKAQKARNDNQFFLSMVITLLKRMFLFVVLLVYLKKVNSLFLQNLRLALMPSPHHWGLDV